MNKRAGQRQSLLDQLGRLWKQLRRQRRVQLVTVIFLTMGSSLAEIISIGAIVPLLAVLEDPGGKWKLHAPQWLSNAIEWYQPTNLATTICLGFAIASGLAGTLRIKTLRDSILTANGITSDISIEVFKRTMYQPYSVHLERKSGDIISAVASQLGQVMEMLNGMILMFSSGIVGISIVAVLVWLSPAVTFTLALIVGGGYGLLSYASKRRINAIGSQIIEDQKQLIRCMQEGIGGFRDIILDGSQKVYIDTYKNADVRLHRNRGIGQFTSLAPRYGMETIGMIAIALVALSLSRNQNGLSSSIPLLSALALGAQRILPIMQLIYSNWSGCRMNVPALSSILDLLEQPIPEIELSGCKKRLTLHSKIECNQVGFRYSENSPWVFRDVNLSIERGEWIGIVGKTGSGKSTLMDLVMGLLESTEGEIRVDGESIKGDILASWRNTIAHVPQSIFLIDGTIAENIALGVQEREIDRDKLERVCKLAQIESMINTLENGYKTGVGERGIKLSGGQRQRIGIARALYKEASVLVLDEATSALDLATESQVMENIKKLSPELTILMIAHRLTTLESCDRIIRVAGANANEV